MSQHHKQQQKPQGKPIREPLYVDIDGKPRRMDVNLEQGPPTANGGFTVQAMEIRGTHIRFGVPVRLESMFGANASYFPSPSETRTRREEEQPAPVNRVRTPARAGKRASDGASSGEEQLFAVEKIVSRKTEKGRIFYEVRWFGYTETTWEPATSLRTQCSDYVNYFELDRKRAKYHEKKATAPLRERLLKMLERRPSKSRAKAIDWH